MPLPVGRIAAAVKEIVLGPARWGDVASAIMTTDTKPKAIATELTLSTGTVHLRGVAKGAGMIHPNMATLLAFVLTDADVDEGALREILPYAAESSFNAISVDGDTSTNDTLLVLANGASGVKARGKDLGAFKGTVRALCEALAREIVADGEGVTRVFEVMVRGATSDEDAKRAARTITTSNLVKTAIHGADPNWGRILAAAGRSGAKVDASRATVRIGEVVVFDSGAPRAFDGERVRAIISQPQIWIEVELGLGSGKAHAWGTDLSAEYVRINADYTT